MNTQPLTLGTFTLKLYLRAAAAIKTVFPMACRGPITHGLAAIPVIIHPIDSGVDWLLGNTTRRVLGHP